MPFRCYLFSAALAAASGLLAHYGYVHWAVFVGLMTVVITIAMATDIIIDAIKKKQ